MGLGTGNSVSRRRADDWLIIADLTLLKARVFQSDVRRERGASPKSFRTSEPITKQSK